MSPVWQCVFLEIPFIICGERLQQHNVGTCQFPRVCSTKHNNHSRKPVKEIQANATDHGPWIPFESLRQYAIQYRKAILVELYSIYFVPILALCIMFVSKFLKTFSGQVEALHDRTGFFEEILPTVLREVREGCTWGLLYVLTRVSQINTLIG